MRSVKTAICFLVITILSYPALASPGLDNAEQVAVVFMQSNLTRDYQKAAGFIDSDSLKAAQTYLIKLEQENVEQGDAQISEALGIHDSVETLKALSPPDFYVPVIGPMSAMPEAARALRDANVFAESSRTRDAEHAEVNLTVVPLAPATVLHMTVELKAEGKSSCSRPQTCRRHSY